MKDEDSKSKLSKVLGRIIKKEGIKSGIKKQVKKLQGLIGENDVCSVLGILNDADARSDIVWILEKGFLGEHREEEVSGKRLSVLDKLREQLKQEGYKNDKYKMQWRDYLKLFCVCGAIFPPLFLGVGFLVGFIAFSDIFSKDTTIGVGIMKGMLCIAAVLCFLVSMLCSIYAARFCVNALVDNSTELEAENSDASCCAAVGNSYSTFFAQLNGKCVESCKGDKNMAAQNRRIGMLTILINLLETAAKDGVTEGNEATEEGVSPCCYSMV